MEPTIEPTVKQYLAYQKLQDKITKYLLFGGAAGGGKTWLICEWLLTCCYFYPGSRWFIGREELKRLRESTLVTFFKVAAFHQIPREDFNYNGSYSTIHFFNGSQISLLDLKYLPSDPLYERFGSLEFTGGAIEEGGEVDYAAFDTLKSRVGRWMNDVYNLIGKILITANPKKNWLYYNFYKPALENKLPSGYAYISALVTDNKYIDKMYVENLNAITDEIKKQRLRFGNWEYDDDPSKLIEYDAIIDLFNNSHVAGGERFISADIARFGADRTVIMMWNGWIAEKIVTLQGKGVDEVAGEIKAMMNEASISTSHVIVDDDGVGGGVKDILKCRGFVNNSKPIEVFNHGAEQFTNLKSQCYFRLAERISKRGVYVKCRVDKIKTNLIEELEQVKQKEVDSDKKKSILAKDEVKAILGRSPDISDALMMREYFDLQPKSKPRITVI